MNHLAICFISHLHSFDFSNFYDTNKRNPNTFPISIPFLTQIYIKVRIILYLPINLIYGEGCLFASLNEAENSFQIKYFTDSDSDGQCLWIQSH